MTAAQCDNHKQAWARWGGNHTYMKKHAEIPKAGKREKIKVIRYSNISVLVGVVMAIVPHTNSATVQC